MPYGDAGGNEKNEHHPWMSSGMSHPYPVHIPSIICRPRRPSGHALGVSWDAWGQSTWRLLMGVAGRRRCVPVDACHTDSVLWGRGDVDRRCFFLTALLFLYRYWCPSCSRERCRGRPGGGNRRPAGQPCAARPGAAPLPAQLRAFYGHSGVALHWHDHLRPAEPASGAWAQTVHTKGAGMGHVWMDGACLCVGMHIPARPLVVTSVVQHGAIRCDVCIS